MIEELLIFSLLGIFVGLAAGMFGIGGGTLIVPVLVGSFLNHGFQEDITIHLALGSSMASIFFTGIASANAHRKKKAIDFLDDVQVDHDQAPCVHHWYASSVRSKCDV